jgi:DNA-binding SARP family transcriptional activator
LEGEDLPWLEPHRERLADVRLRALDLTARAAGAAGDHNTALAAAQTAVVLAGFDERAHRALIRACALAGDRAGAVRAYEQCRATLAEQLGIDPSRETVEVYLNAVQQGDLGPAGRGRAASTPATLRDLGRGGRGCGAATA